jgi:hypothetical protein
MCREFELLLPSNVVALPDDATRRDACLSHLKSMLRSASRSSSSAAALSSASPRRSKKKDRPSAKESKSSSASTAVVPSRRLVRFSFEAEEDDEMSIHVNDVVHVLVVGEPDGWWRGRIDDREGNFPITFTEPIDDDPASTAAAPEQPSQQRGINTLRRVKKRIAK